MCRDDVKLDPFTQSSVDNIVPATLSIQILSGQFLTDKHVGTFVEVSSGGHIFCLIFSILASFFGFLRPHKNVKIFAFETLRLVDLFEL